MIKTILLTLSCLMTIGIYYPMMKRLLRRKSTRDFSKVAQFFIAAVQVNGLLLAIAEHAPFLTAWYIIQTILCSVQFWLICHYWTSVPPLMRREQNGGPLPLECCGKIPSECRCLEENK